MSDVHLYLRDSNLNRIGEIEPMAFTATLRFNAVSNWTMQVPRTHPRALEMAFGSGYGVQVVDGLRPVVSGFIDHKETRWSAGEDALYLGGPDDTILLRDRVARPVPTGPPYTAQSHDVRSGDAGQVFLDYVEYHVHHSSVPLARRVPTLVLPAAPVTGITGTWRARMQVLLDLLVEIATAGGLGFAIVQDGVAFVLRLYVPEDKSATALFSGPLRNLASYAYVKNAPNANHIIVGGGGDLTARLFVEATDTVALDESGRYIETFYNRTDINDAPELAQAAVTELGSKAEQRALTIDPLDTPHLQFGTHYNLGDLVAVRVESTTVVDVVREVSWSLTRDQGLHVVPTVGTSDATDAPDLFNDAQIRDLLARVRQLERAP